MPQAQVIQTRKELPNPLATAIGSFNQRRKEVETQERDADELAKIYEKYTEDQDFFGALKNLNTNPRLSPSRRVEEANRLMQYGQLRVQMQDKELQRYKEKEKQDKARQSVYEIYKDVLPEEEARRRSEFDSEQTARANAKAIRDAQKPGKEGKLSPFETEMQKGAAKELQKLESEIIPKAQDALTNLDKILDLSEGPLSGIKGFVKAGLNTEAASELENLGFTAIEPIIKLFNPVGPIPVAKVKIIRDQFQPKATDLQTTINGKVSVLRRIANQALARAQQRALLLKKYQGNIPPEEAQAFDNESSQLLDVITDEEAFLLNSKDKKDTDLIENLYDKRNGQKLKGIPLKEAKKLFEQGLITYVRS